MMRTLRMALFVLLVPLAACDAPSTAVVALGEGELRDETYHHPGLGWTLPLPSGWHVLTPAEVQVLTGKGKVLLEKSLGTAIVDESVDLLYLKHGPASRFTSARQHHDVQADGPYPALQQALFAAVAQSYRDAGIVIEEQSSSESIDGVVFKRMHVRLMSRDGNDEIAQQFMYDALIGDQGLTVSITAKLASERETMLSAWRKSRFTPRAAGTPETATPAATSTP